jgi:hypothetical protein
VVDIAASCTDLPEVLSISYLGSIGLAVPLQAR